MVYDSTFTIVRWGDVHQLITSTGAPHFLSERGWADGRDVARRGRTSMTKIEAGMMTFPIFLGKYKSHVPGKPPTRIDMKWMVFIFAISCHVS